MARCSSISYANLERFSDGWEGGSNPDGRGIAFTILANILCNKPKDIPKPA